MLGDYFMTVSCSVNDNFAFEKAFAVGLYMIAFNVVVLCWANWTAES